MISRILLIFLTFFVFVASSSNTLAENKGFEVLLQEENQFLLEQIKTQRGKPLITIAKHISISGISDTNLHQALREKVDLIIEERSHFRLRGDKHKNSVTKQELSALTIALGSMGTQSSADLDYLIKKTISIGIGQRAIMQKSRLNWFEARNLVMNSPDGFSSGDSLRTHRLLRLLTSPDVTFGSWAMSTMMTTKGTDPRIYDLLRGILETEMDKSLDYEHRRRLGWICRVLSTFDPIKSKDILTKIEKSSKRTATALNLKRHTNLPEDPPEED